MILFLTSLVKVEFAGARCRPVSKEKKYIVSDGQTFQTFFRQKSASMFAIATGFSLFIVNFGLSLTRNFCSQPKILSKSLSQQCDFQNVFVCCCRFSPIMMIGREKRESSLYFMIKNMKGF